MSRRSWPKYPPGLPIPSYENVRNTSGSIPPLPELPGIIDISDTRSTTTTPSPPFIPSTNRDALRNDRWGGLGMSHAGVYHYRKRKKQPVLSCGIICFYKNGTTAYKEDNVKVLLVRRKDSMSYVEFIRGKYKPSDPLYIRSLVRGMTAEEHHKILTMSFYELWTDMWVTKTIHSHRQEYDKSYRRFKECIMGVRDYIRTLRDPNVDPEWTFPKGRPQSDECDIDCAKREFEEETGIDKTRLHIFSNMPLKEVYTGTNGIVYETHFFIATVDEEFPSINPANRHQIEEVSDVAWISPSEIRTKMRSTYLSKEIVLREAIEQFLMKT